MNPPLSAADAVLLRYDRLPSTGPSMLRAALPAGKGPLAPGTTIPRIEASVPQVAVGAAEVAAYRKVCGFVGEGVPAPYPQVLAGALHMAILAHKAFPLPAMGIVHVSNRIEQREPLRVGDLVRIGASVGGHRQARRGVEFDIITEVDRAGDTIWTAVTTVLSMAGHKGDGDTSAPREKPADPAIGEPGGADRSVIWTVAEDQGRRYSAVSGDRNPIHLYALSAKLFGFRRAIVHGMWSLARCLAELDTAVADTDVRIDVQFKRPVFLPSRVHFCSHATDAAIGYGMYRPKDGKPHLVGSVTRIGDRPSTRNPARNPARSDP